MAPRSRSFAVIGLGTFGSQVARDLTRFGNRVMGIDIDERRVSAIADDIAEAVILDARQDGVLAEAGVADCDVGVVAMGSDVEASILSAMNLRTAGVGEIWAKATTRNHHRILSRIGVNRVVHPEIEVGQHVAQMLNNPMVYDYLRLGNGQHVVSFRVPESLAGRTLDEVKGFTRFDLRCIGLVRGSAYLCHDGVGQVLAPDDRLLLLGKRSDLRRFADSL